MAEAVRKLNCAIYTRKSSEEGLEQDFNSLHAQREACEAFILSQKHEGWRVDRTEYDDGGYSGGTMERPAFQRLLADIRQGLIDVVVVYKVDRLTRSLADFSKIVETFDAHGVSFVSVTQQFNTSTSMGRLTLNVLLSFAQFEREVTGERIRDKLAMSAKKGLWRGGRAPLGYDVKDKKLVANPEEAERVQHIFRRYLALGCVSELKRELDGQDQVSKVRISAKGGRSGGERFTRGALYELLRNRIYLGEVVHKGQPYPGEHEAIVEKDLFDQVQEQLRAHRTRHFEGHHAKEPSLLSGLLFDERGNFLSPTHATKQGKRYRYYTNQALIQFRPDDAGAIRRVPAHEVESLVTGQLFGFLQDGPRLLDTLAPGTPADGQHEAILAGAERLVQGWEALAPGDRKALVRAIIEKVVIMEGAVEIDLSREGLAERLGVAGIVTQQPNADGIRLRAEARLKRLGGETKLIIRNGPPEPPAQHPDPGLVEALVQAHVWRRRFEEDPTLRMKDLASEAGLSENYAARMLRLAYLAPDLTEAILQGTQPRKLSLKMLLRGIPLSWAEQRRKLELASV
jgi:DNA invertase Pin-like site-specific DNA recombinase